LTNQLLDLRALCHEFSQNYLLVYIKCISTKVVTLAQDYTSLNCTYPSSSFPQPLQRNQTAFSLKYSAIIIFQLKSKIKTESGLELKLRLTLT
jgi:hypothetical protein